MKLKAFLMSLVLIFSSTYLTAAKVDSTDEAVPAELLAGTAGGAIVGFGAGYLMSEICLSQTTGLDSIGCIGPLILGYIIGVPTGAIIGVNLAGSIEQINGNILLSILGGIGGGAIGMLTAASLMSAIEENTAELIGIVAFLGVAPFLASLGATWGFNSGAEIRPDSEPVTTRSQIELALIENLLVP